MAVVLRHPPEPSGPGAPPHEPPPAGRPASASGPRRVHGRLQLLLIVLVTVGPMVLATLMYQWQFWVPQSRSYHGELIGDGRTVAELGVTAPEQRWLLLVSAPSNCDEDCRQLVYLARQIQIGLGRDAGRARHGLASAQPVAADYQQRLTREYPQLQRYALDPERYARMAQGVQLWIVDPHGNLVLRYGPGVDGKDVLIDLRQLLKLSNIG